MGKNYFHIFTKLLINCILITFYMNFRKFDKQWIMQSERLFKQRNKSEILRVHKLEAVLQQPLWWLSW